MSLFFSCPGCQKTLEAGADLVGRRMNCSDCGTVTIVPASEVEEASMLVAPANDRADPAGHGSSGSPSVGFAQQGSATYSDGQEYSGGLTVPQPRPGVVQPLRNRLMAVNALVEQRRYLEATQALKPFSEEAAGNPGYHYLAGMAFSGMGNYPHALDHLGRAVEGGIATPPVFAAKGKAELELGQHVNAIESLDTALEISGTDVPDYMADLARAYDGANMPRDAAATWSALARINPNHPALVDRERSKQELRSRKLEEQRTQAMIQMQKEQKASDTACWVCLIIRILLECI